MYLGVHFVAGLSSGVVSAIILQPIDLLKTRVQQSGRRPVVEVVREIRRSSDTMASFWRGTVPSVIRTGFGSAIYFTILNFIRHHASQATSQTGTYVQFRSSSLPMLDNWTNMASGMAARSLAGFVLMPLTVIKVRYESSFYTYRSILDASRDILEVEGIRGFFSGVGATIIRDAPNAGLYVLFYEQFKKQLSFVPSKTSNSFSAPTINFFSGALAGACCSVVSNPFDAVKTRIQLRPSTYQNMRHAATKLIKEEGVLALWNGLTLRMSRKAIGSALAWTIYEELLRAGFRFQERKQLI